MSFIFQMDNAADQQPIASTSSSGRRLLVDYAPKPVALSEVSQRASPRSPSPRGIESWLASHGSSYLPHDQPTQQTRGPSPRRARPSNNRRFSFHSDSESSCGSSDSELEDDEAIFLQPRRHLSRQSSAQTGPVPAQTQTITRKLTPPIALTAQRPALPVVDLSAASGHVELQQQLQSHWSDDESEVFSEEEELTDEDEDESDDAEVEDGFWALHPDELEVPALVDDDESGPASTSTRSIPIPHAHTPARIGQGLMSRRLAPSSSPRRKTSMDGQSFWTPWMDRYLADAAARA
ncbi:hypothetical protein M408DRAFT_326533 [Serendipita vermifera MAFF 305830]|uniref:Uncharacterized protein n=1 Tax=Serendipita vermifera MAFF 305830 TaxID=933852 RepID=A0A0C3BMY5_SERVB|nr:hypothetical protein M408DRAFT_326533 [Serendipita vermifera MAFF 305830]